MPRKKTTTLKDLADELGLSVFTVSKALRGLPGMSEETRKAVIDLAYKRKYRTKNQERELAVEQIPLYTDKPKRFKLITKGNSLLHQTIMEGLQEVLSQFDHIIEPLFMSDEIIDQAQFEAFVEKHNLNFMEGLFIPPGFTEHVVDYFISLDVPQIHIHFPAPHADVDSVIWDVEQAIIDSVLYLYKKGHRDILYIGDTIKTRGYILRWNAFQQTMRDLGIPVNPDHHVIGDRVDNDQWIEQMVQKISSRRPTAVLCAIDYNLAWVFFACSKIGLSIPEDISLVSLDLKENDLMPDISRPMMPIKETGRRAAERMLWRLANPTSPYEHVRLKGPFHEGNTVKTRRKKMLNHP